MPNEYEEMTNEQMEAALLALDGSPALDAIKKFVTSHDAHCVSAIASTDPFKNPTELARYQGMRNGLYALENYIKYLAEESKKKEEENTDGK